ncbi:MAG: phosphatase PAP2 family protein [Nocardioidaceae bacterium]|nr:phosphatase PAP2 family protein [Nocardioidaceae bacterium]
MTIKPRLDSSQARRVALAVVGFVLLALDVVSGGLVAHFDQALRGWLQPQPGSVIALLDVAGDLGNVGVSAALLGISGAVTSHVLWKVWPILFVGSVFLVTQGLIYLTKLAVGRDGPGMWADRTDYPGYYPSGHTATAAVCAGSVVFLALLSRRGVSNIARAANWGSAVGLLAGALAAAHAVVGDFHWFSDGVGGLLLALGILTIAFAVVPTDDLRSQALEPPRRDGVQ